MISYQTKAKEKILVNIYDKVDFKIGDKVKVYGSLILPSKNRNFYTFNYKNYLLSKKIYYTMTANQIFKIKDNKNLLNIIKQNIIDKTSNYEYVKAFILGDTTSLNMDSYRINGISHLFAISGMHITFITMLLSKILTRINKRKQRINNIIIFIFLCFYMFITSFSVSVVRASLMFMLININKELKLNLKTIEILMLIFIILMFINPYYLFNISFQYSFIVSLYLIIFNKLINKNKNYFYKLFMISLISVLVSFPITINNFHTINFLSIILNIIFVPFFTYIIFPLTIISFIIPFTNFIFVFFINIFNYLSNFFGQINILNFSFSYINIIWCLFYYSFITIILCMVYKKKYFYLIILILYFIIHYHSNYFNLYNSIIMFDVGQGDSLLINLKNNHGSILIDTGGNINSNYNMALNIIIPYLQSVGIHKLNYLILTHGDYDHMGEAINLVKNFKVEKVIFNCGEYNNLESELIKVLDKKKIKYYSCIKKLNIDKNKLYFLQTKVYDNENDNSNVIYTEINGYKFMFMGDASSTTEKEIMSKYDLPDIDVLKVGHHGSKTSSSKDFINEINPKYSIISVGKNNRYGHPNKEVLDNLNNSRIYRTDINGSISFKIKNNKLKIETCAP